MSAGTCKRRRDHLGDGSIFTFMTGASCFQGHRALVVVIVVDATAFSEDAVMKEIGAKTFGISPQSLLLRAGRSRPAISLRSSATAGPELPQAPAKISCRSGPTNPASLRVLGFVGPKRGISDDEPIWTNRFVSGTSPSPCSRERIAGPRCSPGRLFFP